MTLLTVGTIKSRISEKEYEISIDEKGNYSCSCFAWIYNKGGSKLTGCKHIREYLTGKGIEMPDVPVIPITKKKLVKNKKILQAMEDLKNCL